MKASIALYIDTGLVALVCQHDRLLWLANLMTPGERQHYAFALLQKLFDNLPSDWNIGMLYDIACQVERSVVKVHDLVNIYAIYSFTVPSNVAWHHGRVLS